ncbi:MAG: DegT/DnrJ/EryC1/StrS aminotransferase [Microgenomates group bacterium GW2011_GWB1_44_8]|nr:MAG: DegT/DnrJ/EryC1/StrS aminotransferase [Microgenomates group bacterium GW2011_GWB1_44_8]
MIRPVNIGLSPNLEVDDFELALKVLIKGGDKKARQGLVEWFEDYFLGYSAVLFNSGRSAEWAIIKALELKTGDEVLYQDFTCVAVPNSVEWAGVAAIAVVTDPQTLDMDITDLEKKINSRTKAVIVQHTFGLAANVEKIKAICETKGLVMIEDCAHALGATYKGEKLGTFGQVAFLSLGRDKVISSVFGGVVISKDTKLIKRLRKIEDELPENSRGWIVQQLLHPILTWLFLPVYDLGLGKLGLWVAQKLGLLSKAVYSIEKRGGQPKYFPAKYSYQLAWLGLHQLQKLEKFNDHRRKIAEIYFEELADTELKLPVRAKGNIYLRFTVVHPRARELYLRAKVERKWVLGDWYKSAIQVLNLPTYPGFTANQAKELCEQLKIWLKSKK